MSNVYDQAYLLEKAVRESDGYQNLKSAFETVMGNPESKKLFEDFRNTQIQLQEKQMQGAEITEEEVEAAKTVVEAVQSHESISKLMEAEQHLNVIINEVSGIIMKPLEDLYGAPGEQE